MDSVYNFAAGPSALPRETLEQAAREMTNYRQTGVSVMEMSHRSGMYLEIFDEVVALIRGLMAVPDDYSVLLLQGGASLQFASVPMNLLSRSADYIDSGHFAHSAMKEAEKYGAVRCVASSRDLGYTHVPDWSAADLDPDADYVHITTNNTIFGTRFTRLPETGAVPLVADMSSNVLSEPYDVKKFGVIYAGAQKNLGPAGLTLVLVQNALMGRARPTTPKVMDYKALSGADSMVNTPPTYAIYMTGLCLKWLKRMGGVAGIEKINIEKANLLYDFIDGSRLFKGTARPDSRSRMNVTFAADSKDEDAAFIKAAAARGFINLKGHRLVGGMRASIYNAMPIEGVRALVEFMKEYEAHV